jgi:hypothetical protein
MRRTIAVLAVALLTMTAGCSSLAGTAGPSTNAQPDAADQGAQISPGGGPDRTVAVGASGTVQAAPNRAIVRVAVTARADSVETVRQRLADNASRMRDALEAAGLEAGQITSARYDIRRNYRHEERPSEPEYQGAHSFVVTLNETDRAGQTVVTAVENGATRVDGVEFTLTAETRRDLRTRALGKAVANAREKAGVAADGAGLSLAGVRTVRTGDVSVEPVRRDVAYETAAAGDGGAPTSIEGGKVTVAAQATVVYNATDG